jgi:succinate dehydrogenase/fumarate reductase flavoprotein subunit
MKPRADALRDVAGQSFDVCVIGGGATGAGCALDAQLRGFEPYWSRQEISPAALSEIAAR